MNLDLRIQSLEDNVKFLIKRVEDVEKAQTAQAKTLNSIAGMLDEVKKTGRIKTMTQRGRG